MVCISDPLNMSLQPCTAHESLKTLLEVAGPKTPPMPPPGAPAPVAPPMLDLGMAVKSEVEDDDGDAGHQWTEEEWKAWENWDGYEEVKEEIEEIEEEGLGRRSMGMMHPTNPKKNPKRKLHNRWNVQSLPQKSRKQVRARVMIVMVMDMGKMIPLAMLTRAGMIAHGSGAIVVGVVGGHGDGKTTVRGGAVMIGLVPLQGLQGRCNPLDRKLHGHMAQRVRAKGRGRRVNKTSTAEFTYEVDT